MRLAIIFLSFIAIEAFAQTAQRGLMMISIDGLKPDYVTQADQHHLKIPNLRRLLTDGAHAEGVRGVLPTVTYPSHTTLVTGVWPSKHGILNNVAFDPLEKNLEGWYWYSEDIRVPTLWQAAAHAGYVVGSVSWPASVGAPGVNFLIPEYWRASTSDDLKLLRAVSTPGLLSELQEKLGPYIIDLNDAVAGDWGRTRYAEAIVRQKHARFMTVHLAALDHLEHAAGPFSAEANATLEIIDDMVGVLAKAMRDESPAAALCVVSDHGFAAIDHQLNLNVAFVKSGLITPNPKKTALTAPGVTSWKADAWSAGGSYFIVLKDQNDVSTKNAVEKLLHEVAADPANGIDRILDRKEIAALGGAPTAEFVVDMKPGFSAGTALEGPLMRAIKPGGTHGYSPAHPEMRASFMIAGDGIRQGLNLGDIDMRSIAPTLAGFLRATLPSADLPALDILAGGASH
jgi:predicted AlkP superfamily pyrophosphatase or phosphodiesterase